MLPTNTDESNELTCQSFGKEFAMSVPLHKTPIKLHSFSLFKVLNRKYSHQIYK